MSQSNVGGAREAKRCGPDFSASFVVDRAFLGLVGRIIKPSKRRLADEAEEAERDLIT